MTWDESPFLVFKDASGEMIQVMPATADEGRLQLDISLHLPLLYWEERRQWMWHKKWCLPRLRARLRSLPSGAQPAWHSLHVMVSAGTIPKGQTVELELVDQGLLGTCQQPLEGGEAVFSSLQFKHTSFNCGGRSFHLVVSLIAVLSEVEQAHEHRLRGVVCYCSSPIHVDARKRSKVERPCASANDIRLQHRGHDPFSTVQNHLVRTHSFPPNASSATALLAIPVASTPNAAQLSSSHMLATEAQSAAMPIPSTLVTASTPRAISASAEAATVAALVQAMGCTVLELRHDLLITSVLSTSCLGYRPEELVGTSFLNLIFPDEHTALVQTTQSLLAFSYGGNAAKPIGSVRAIHRARMRNGDGTITTIVIDSTIAAIGGSGGQPLQLMLTMRYATPPLRRDTPVFRVFPANVPLTSDVFYGGVE